jgi:hypothetical protein
LRPFGANGCQFACIQPVAVAIGALVNFNSAFGAEEMTHQLDSYAARAISLARRIDRDILTVLNFKQMLPGAFFLLVNTLKFKCVEPNAAATALADVNLDTANLLFRQFIEASWTFHGCALFGYFEAKAASTAAITSGDSGAAFESKRLMILPSRPMRNLLKFHLMFPG